MKAKNIYLYHEGKPCYYARYRIKIRDSSGAVKTRYRNVSTLQTDKVAAQKVANDRYRADWQAFWDGVEGKSKNKEPFSLRDTTPNCGQIVDIYREHSRSEYSKQVSDVFLTVIAEGKGWIDPTNNRERARKVKLSELNMPMMIAFRDQTARKKAGLPIERNAVSINTYMRQAKSVFARPAREYYIHLNLPMHAIRNWAEVTTLPEDHYEQKFISFGPEQLARVDEAAQQMLGIARSHEGKRPAQAKRWRNAFATFSLMRWCGLRNVECQALRWEWIRPRVDGHYWIDVIKRPYWRPKRGSGVALMHRELYAQLLELFGSAQLGKDGFVLSGTMTDRKEGVSRVLQGFVRRYVQQGDKNAYTLRKQYATTIEQLYGPEIARLLLRHTPNKSDTAQRHYLDGGEAKLAKIEPLWKT